MDTRALAKSKVIRATLICTAVAAVLPFAATQAVHLAFDRPLLDSADTAMLSGVFAVAVLMFATLGLAGAARDLEPPDSSSDR